ncbi:MAG: MFS transporter [Microbacterium sp.]|uniref:MFS transporter n=1 Tax=Microbacterium sp. TaxID=51671 RepID=UPI003D6FBFD8
MDRESVEAQHSAAIDHVTDARTAPRPSGMRVGAVAAVLLAQLVISIALITPSTYTLAIWLNGAFPANRDSLLALAIGASNVVSMVVGPIVGGLSDHTRSKWGPRRTWLVAGIAVGTLGSAVLVWASTPVQLVMGWCVAAIGYGVANSMVLTHLSDRLALSQRGLVLGISSAVVYLGPVAGVLIVGAVSTTRPLMFAVPGIAVVIGGGLLAALMTDPPLPVSAPRLHIRRVLNSFWFDPRRYPRFGWVWLNRGAFFLGVSFMTLYSVFFLSTQVGLDAAEIAATVSIAGVIGVVVSTAAGTIGGALSDRTSSRLPFLVVSILLLCGGLLVIATATDVVQYLIGNAINAVAMGVYSAVSQALQFDELPIDDVQNGRYLAVLGLATQIPSAIGPFLASAVLALTDRQYSLMYVSAAALMAASLLALIPLRRRAQFTARTSTPDPQRNA